VHSRWHIATDLCGGKWKLIKEFVEVESGRRSDRPRLAEALAMCRAHRAALVVAKVDRLARSQSFLSRIVEAGVDVRFCDLPQIEGPTGRFLLQSIMAVAELEAGMISPARRPPWQQPRPEESSWEASEVVPAPQQTPPELVLPGRLYQVHTF
jgi:DNA invertase Pin-like site-specific DNA recombinase